MPSSHLIFCHPLLLLPPIPPSIRVFSNESTLHMRWPKYWSFSFSISPSNEHPGLISFWMDWLDLLAVQGMLKSLLQHHNSIASILQSLIIPKFFEKVKLLLTQLFLTLCQPTRLLWPWNSPGKNTGVGSHSLIQGIFQIQGSHIVGRLYHVSPQGSPLKR